MATTRPLALVTGASSGIGLQLALCCAKNHFDLVVVADRPLDDALYQLRAAGAEVTPVEANLSTADGVAKAYEGAAGRPIAALLANAGQGLGHAFLDQPFDAVQRVIDTNVTGTLGLVHRVGNDMRTRGEGRILITGSIAGTMPGTYQAVYNASKAFIDSFAIALGHELKDSGVTVTCLMPGPTDTEFFERGDLADTKMGTGPKDPPDEVAQTGFDAMMKGESHVIFGVKNKLQAAMANVAPVDMTAEMHAKMAAPGSGKR